MSVDTAALRALADTATEGPWRAATAGAVRAAVPALCDEVDRLRAEVARLEWADGLVDQSCPLGQHQDWFILAENHYRCPWCALDRVRALAVEWQAIQARNLHRARTTGGHFEDTPTPSEFLAAIGDQS